MRIMLCDVTPQPVFLTGMVCLHQFQLRYLNIEIHFFFYVRITCGKCLDLCIGKCRFIHILTASYRRFTGHNLSDEFLLILNELPRIRIECIFRYIPEYFHSLIPVALAEYSSLLLFYVRWSPRHIYVVECYEPCLHIGAGSHLCC